MPLSTASWKLTPPRSPTGRLGRGTAVSDQNEYLWLLLAAETDLRAFVVVGCSATRRRSTMCFRRLCWRFGNGLRNTTRARPFGAWALGVAAKKLLQRRERESRFSVHALARSHPCAWGRRLTGWNRPVESRRQIGAPLKSVSRGWTRFTGSGSRSDEWWIGGEFPISFDWQFLGIPASSSERRTGAREASGAASGGRAVAGNSQPVAGGTLVTWGEVGQSAADGERGAAHPHARCPESALWQREVAKRTSQTAGVATHVWRGEGRPKATEDVASSTSCVPVSTPNGSDDWMARTEASLGLESTRHPARLSWDTPGK